MIAAARSVRKAIAPNSKLIIALPVAPRHTVNNLLMKEADYIEDNTTKISRLSTMK
jgi:predicted phosphoribosyltransferase